MSDAMCPIHEGTSMRHFEKDGREWWSHKLDDGTWCNGKPKKPEQSTYGKRVETKSEEKVDWDAKDRQSMAQTAMKSASEIVAAQLNAGVLDSEYFRTYNTNVTQLVKDMANSFYKELLRMKTEL